MCLHDARRLLQQQTYPTTTAELASACDSEELRYANGSEAMRDVLARVGDARFDDSEEAYRAVCGAVGSGAIGRKYYSDRDGNPAGTDQRAALSF